MNEMFKDPKKYFERLIPKEKKKKKRFGLF
jgi:hypothetical protein